MHYRVSSRISFLSRGGGLSELLTSLWTIQISFKTKREIFSLNLLLFLGHMFLFK